MKHQLIMVSFGLASSGVKNMPELSAIQKVNRKPTEVSSLECLGKLFKMKMFLNARVVQSEVIYPGSF